jgi:predicted DNA-binding transcriptional regulator AlpA
MDNIVLISIPQDKLKDLIREAIREELSYKKDKELLNFKETCEFLGISPSALNKWKSENRIPYKKLGKRVFFNRQELLESLKNSNYSRLKQIQC